MSAEKILTFSEQAHNRRETFLGFKQQSTIVIWELCWTIRKAQDWKHLGFESEREYFIAPQNSGGLDVSRSWFIQMALSYNACVLAGWTKTDIEKFTPSKIYFLKDKITSSNYEEIKALCENNTLKDLKLLRRKVDEAHCEHKWENFRKCAKCGVYEKRNNF